MLIPASDTRDDITGDSRREQEQDQINTGEDSKLDIAQSTGFGEEQNRGTARVPGGDQQLAGYET